MTEQTPDQRCADCRRPRSPDHDADAPGPTVRHPFRAQHLDAAPPMVEAAPRVSVHAVAADVAGDMSAIAVSGLEDRAWPGLVPPGFDVEDPHLTWRGGDDLRTVVVVRRSDGLRVEVRPAFVGRALPDLDTERAQIARLHSYQQYVAARAREHPVLAHGSTDVTAAFDCRRVDAMVELGPGDWCPPAGRYLTQTAMGHGWLCVPLRTRAIDRVNGRPTYRHEWRGWRDEDMPTPSVISFDPAAADGYMGRHARLVIPDPLPPVTVPTGWTA